MILVSPSSLGFNFGLWDFRLRLDIIIFTHFLVNTFKVRYIIKGNNYLDSIKGQLCNGVNLTLHQDTEVRKTKKSCLNLT